MSHLAPIASTALCASAGSIPHSPSNDPDEFHEAPGQLGSAIRTLCRGVTVEISPALADQATRHLERIRPLFEMASDVTILDWLRAMGAGVAKAGDDARNVAARVQAVFATCRHLPVGVWTEQTRVAFWQRHKWWPEPADLLAFLQPYAESLRRQRSGCEALQMPAEISKPMDAAPMTADQRKAMAMEFRRLALAAIAEGASQCRVPSDSPTRRPIVRNRVDDMALLDALQARAANQAVRPDVRAACARTAADLHVRLMGEGTPPQ